MGAERVALGQHRSLRLLPLTRTAVAIEPADAPTRLHSPGAAIGLRSSTVVTRGLSAGPSAPGPTAAALSRRSRLTRLAACAVILVLVLAGSVFGSDDDFPLGPFHMYSTRTNPNAISRELRVQLVLANGAVIDVTNASGAPRRAELEGRIGQLQADPAEVEKLVPLYTDHVSGSPRRLQLVWENHPLHNGKTAAAYDTPILSVAVPQ